MKELHRRIERAVARLEENFPPPDSNAAWVAERTRLLQAMTDDELRLVVDVLSDETKWESSDTQTQLRELLDATARRITESQDEAKL